MNTKGRITSMTHRTSGNARNKTGASVRDTSRFGNNQGRLPSASGRLGLTFCLDLARRQWMYLSLIARSSKYKGTLNEVSNRSGVLCRGPTRAQFSFYGKCVIADPLLS